MCDQYDEAFCALQLTNSSDKTQLVCSTKSIILLCLFTSKYDSNGSRLNYSSSTVSSNKVKYINM